MSSSRPTSKYYSNHERVPSSSRPRVASTSTRDQESHPNSHSHSRSHSTSKAAERRADRSNVLTRETITVKRSPLKQPESRSNSRRSRDDGRQNRQSAATTPTAAEPKKEEPRGTPASHFLLQLLTPLRAMEAPSLPRPAHHRSSCLTSFHSATCLASSRRPATTAIGRAICGGSRVCHYRRSSLCIHGI